MPFFSIVIPSFNRYKSLIECLDSVVSQEFEDYEIIIIDDGSRDDFKSSILLYIRDLNDSRVNFIDLPYNQGGGAARNVGIKKSNGKYICFLDSDDKWESNKLKVEHEFLNKKPATDILHSKIINVVNSVEVEVVPNRSLLANESISDYLFSGIKGGRGMQTSTLVVRSILAKKILFDSSLRGHQDWDFLLRISLEKPTVGFIPYAFTRRSLVLDKNKNKNFNVSAGLGYKFSKEFLLQRKSLFSAKSKIYFRTRVLLKKSIIDKEEVLKNIMYWGNLLDLGFVSYNTYRALRKKILNTIFKA